jgi:tetratricopeptide (TPR) repeat protein
VGGDGGTASSGSSAAGPGATAASWEMRLVQAERDVAQGAFATAQREAEALLQPGVPRAFRARALLVAADAARALGAYRAAAARYREFLGTPERGVAAPRAAMGLGWAELRHGAPDQARRSWTWLADMFPADAHAPVALTLAAELATQAGDARAAQQALDRVVTGYPAAPVTAAARLGRALTLLRRGREHDAVRELELLVRVDGPAALEQRGRLLAALAEPAAERGVGVASAAAAAGGDALERFVAAALDARHRVNGPQLLHGVVAVGVARRGWSDALVATAASRLLEQFPAYPSAATLLARVAAAAVAAGQWPIARQAYETLLAQAPAGFAGDRARVDLAEALLRTGAAAEARSRLEQAARNGSAEAPRALHLLIEVAEATGDRGAALSAYDRLLRDHPRLERTPKSLFAHARLLEDAGQAQRARPLFQSVVRRGGGEVAAEAAYRVARGLGADGQHEAALEWYMTAAYVDGDSAWSRRALLEAGSTLSAMNQWVDALAVYEKLVPPRNGATPPEQREAGGEAAYRAAELLRSVGQHGDALEMYLAAAHFTAGSPAEGRALLGALRCLIAMGQREQAEVIYRRLLESRAAWPDVVATAGQAIGDR